MPRTATVANRAGLLLAAVVACTATTTPALAASNVSITPHNHAKFLSGQRFDIRVEGQGTGPYSATLAIDGVPQAFTSGDQNTTTTDGISTSGCGVKISPV